MKQMACCAAAARNGSAMQVLAAAMLEAAAEARAEGREAEEAKYMNKVLRKCHCVTMWKG